MVWDEIFRGDIQHSTTRVEIIASAADTQGNISLTYTEYYKRPHKHKPKSEMSSCFVNAIETQGLGRPNPSLTLRPQLSSEVPH